MSTSNIVKKISALILTYTICSNSFGCPIPEAVYPNKLELYSSIFSAKVDQFEWHKQSIFWNSDLTAPYTVHVSEMKALYGKLPNRRTFKIGAGCGILFPSIGATMEFFVEKSRDVIIPMRPGMFRKPKKQKINTN